MKDMILETNFTTEYLASKQKELHELLPFCNNRFIVKARNSTVRWVIFKQDTTLMYKVQQIESAEGIEGKVKIWVDMNKPPTPCPDLAIAWLYHVIGNRLNWDAWDSLSKEQKSTYFNDQMQQE